MDVLGCQAQTHSGIHSSQNWYHSLFVAVLTKCNVAVLVATSAHLAKAHPVAVLTKRVWPFWPKKSVDVLVATHPMWPFWPKQCGRFDQSSVAVLVVIPLSVAILVVAVLECGRFDWFPSHHNPQPKRSSSSGTLNMIPPWNIHTVKQSMQGSCSNGCSLNWFTPSEFFQFSQPSN